MGRQVVPLVGDRLDDAGVDAALHVLLDHEIVAQAVGARERGAQADGIDGVAHPGAVQLLDAVGHGVRDRLARGLECPVAAPEQLEHVSGNLGGGDRAAPRPPAQRGGAREREVDDRVRHQGAGACDEPERRRQLEGDEPHQAWTEASRAPSTRL